jgi:Asp-tRNA(Asn)/Glu-tRNA(Gln) amidotransferase B subunit
MGQLMKLSQGTIDPKAANQLMLDALANSSSAKSEKT